MGQWRTGGDLRRMKRELICVTRLLRPRVEIVAITKDNQEHLVSRVVVGGYYSNRKFIPVEDTIDCRVRAKTDKFPMSEELFKRVVLAK